MKRYKIEDFQKEAKALGLGEYRFRTSEASLIQVYLVCLSFILLDVLRRRLLHYGIKKSLISIEATVKRSKKRLGIYWHLK